MTTRNPWAYPVSVSTRRREVDENEQIIAWCDKILALTIPLPVGKDDPEVWVFALKNAEHAAAFGLSRIEAAAVSYRTDMAPTWLEDEPDPPRAYQLGEAVCNRLESTYGKRIESREVTKIRRSTAVRRLRTAKDAIVRAGWQR